MGALERCLVLGRSRIKESNFGVEEIEFAVQKVSERQITEVQARCQAAYRPWMPVHAWLGGRSLSYCVAFASYCGSECGGLKGLKLIPTTPQFIKECHCVNICHGVLIWFQIWLGWFRNFDKGWFWHPVLMWRPKACQAEAPWPTDYISATTSPSHQSTWPLSKYDASDFS